MKLTPECLFSVFWFDRIDMGASVLMTSQCLLINNGFVDAGVNPIKEI